MDFERFDTSVNVIKTSFHLWTEMTSIGPLIAEYVVVFSTSIKSTYWINTSSGIDLKSASLTYLETNI